MTETSAASAVSTETAPSERPPEGVTVNRLDATQVELEIPIDAKVLEAAQDRAFKDLAKNVKIPGFRPGKVPRRIFEAQYGTQAIVERAFESVVPSVYTQAMRDNQLEPVEEPQMELMPTDDGGLVRIKATVTVRPEITLGTYSGIVVEAHAASVTDADLERAVQEVARDAADLVPVERPVAMGDTATIDYEGKIDGVPFEGGKAENQPTEILEDRFIPGFAAGIVGMSAGETKEVDATFPDPYSNPELAGKPAVFTITVHDVKAPQIPAVDDELAKRYKPDGTLEELRGEIRARLESQALHRRSREISGKVMDALLAAHEVPLPAVMVDREVVSLVDEAKQYVTRAGIAWEQYLEGQGKTEDVMREEYRTEAERRVKSTLLLEAIAKQESVQATPEDIEAEIEGLVQQYRQPREAILKMLQPNLGALVDGIVRTKAVDWLVQHAAVTDSAPDPVPEA